MLIWLLKDGEQLPIEGDVRPMRMWMLANELVDRGHEVVWWSSTFSHQQKSLVAEGDLSYAVRDRFRLELLNAGAYSRNLSLKRVLHHRRLARRFATQAREEERPDLIVAAHPIPNLSCQAVRFAREENIPVVVDIRDLWPDALEQVVPSMLKPLVKLAFRPYYAMTQQAMAGCTALVACSRTFLEWGLECGKRQASPDDRVFYLGYPSPTDQPAVPSGQLAEALARADGKTILCFIGSFGLAYELTLVGEAAKRAAAEDDDVFFMIAGKGEQDGVLRAAYGALPNLAFLGWLDRKQVQHLLEVSNVGLIPCKSPAGAAINKIFEYLSHGLPVISSLKGEMAEIFERRKIGFSYQTGDADGLYDQIQAMLASPKLIAEMSGNAKLAFSEMFAAEEIYAAFADHLENIVSNSKTPGTCGALSVDFASQRRERLIDLPELGFGCWAIGGHGYGDVDDSASETALHAAWEAGIRMFDTANVYGLGRSERVLGKALADHMDEALITTKGGVVWDDRGRTGKDCSPAALRRALEDSLRRLGIDCVPIYQVHWHDGRTPLPAIIETMQTFRDEGKIRWIGCSNFGPEELGGDATRTGYDTIQLPFSLLDRSKETFLSNCRRAGMATIVYDVLARGLLADKFNEETTWPENDTRATDPLFQGKPFTEAIKVAQGLRRISQNIGRDPAAVALRWAIQHEAVSCAIVGCKTEEQVQSNISVLDWRLEAIELGQIESLLPGAPKP